MKHKSTLFVVVISPLCIFALVSLFGLKINYIESLLLVFGIPNAYLSLRDTKKVRKVATFTLLVSIPIALIFEIIAFGDHAWVVPQSIVPFRLLGIMPLEDYLWMFLTTYIIIIFYEYFFRKDFQPNFPRRIRVMNLLLYSIAFLIVLAFVSHNPILKIPYAYLWLGITFFLIPIFIFLFRNRGLFLSFAKVALYFFYAHLVFELVGLKLNHWTFPGTHYLGWVTILGLRFPVEELFFVMIIGTFAACTYYEYFANERPSSNTRISL